MQPCNWKNWSTAKQFLTRILENKARIYIESSILKYRTNRNPFLEREQIVGFEPTLAVGNLSATGLDATGRDTTGLDPAGGVKGDRPSKKDRLRAAALAVSAESKVPDALEKPADTPANQISSSQASTVK